MGTTVYVQTPTPPIIVRTPGRVSLPVAVVRGRVSETPGPITGRINPKGVTTTTPDSKISGNPIDQLNETRNPRTFDTSRHPEKQGVYERAGALLPMERETGNTTRRRQEALRGVFAETLINDSPGAVLASNGSGFDFYRGPRIKPALPRPNGWEIPAPTRPSTWRGSEYINLVSPLFTSHRLASEGAVADANMGQLPWVATSDATDLYLPSPEVNRASTDPLGDAPANLAGPLLLAGVILAALVVLR